jgi:hypothetical protein
MYFQTLPSILFVSSHDFPPDVLFTLLVNGQELLSGPMTEM